MQARRQLIHELLLFIREIIKAIRQSTECLTKRCEHLLGVSQIEEINGGEVLPIDVSRTPIFPMNRVRAIQKSSRIMRMAWTLAHRIREAPAPTRSASLRPLGMKPLLKLVEDDDHLLLR